MELTELTIIDSQSILYGLLPKIANNFGFQPYDAMRLLIDNQVEVEQIFEKPSSQYGIAVNSFYKRNYCVLCQIDECLKKTRTAGRVAPHIYRQLICLVYLENRLRAESRLRFKRKPIEERIERGIKRKPKPRFIVLLEKIKRFLQKSF